MELFGVIHRDGSVRRILTNRFPYRIFFSVVGETLYVHRFFTARDTIVGGQSDCEHRSISLSP
jgi:hypothetical protein